MRSRLRAVGTSTGMIVPAKVAKELQMIRGDAVEVVPLGVGFLVLPAGLSEQDFDRAVFTASMAEPGPSVRVR